MSEARDMLVRPVDIAAVFGQRRQGVLEIFEDQPESTSNPLRRASNAAAAPPRVRTTAGGSAPRRGGSGLPSWYPRKPLGDITAVLKAIEGLHANQAGVVDLESLTPQEIDNVEKSLKRTPTSNKAKWENEIRFLMSLSSLR